MINVRPTRAPTWMYSWIVQTKMEGKMEGEAEGFLVEIKVHGPPGLCKQK